MGELGTANTVIHPHSPVIHVQKRHNILELFCHLTLQTTKTVYLDLSALRVYQIVYAYSGALQLVL